MINNHMLRIGALFLLTVLCYGFYNAYLPITDPVESNYVLSAITMLKHNSWISLLGTYDYVQTIWHIRLYISYTEYACCGSQRGPNVPYNLPHI